MDIEKVAKETPEKIITKIDFNKEGPSESEIEEIVSIFKFKSNQQEDAKKINKDTL